MIPAPPAPPVRAHRTVSAAVAAGPVGAVPATEPGAESSTARPVDACEVVTAGIIKSVAKTGSLSAHPGPTERTMGASGARAIVSSCNYGHGRTPAASLIILSLANRREASREYAAEVKGASRNGVPGDAVKGPWTKAEQFGPGQIYVLYKTVVLNFQLGSGTSSTSYPRGTIRKVVTRSLVRFG